MSISKETILIYSDGACAGNPGPGGWGACIIRENEVEEIFGSDPQTTNNRMELQGAIEGLKSLKVSSTVELYTDSQYLRLGITQWIKNWMRNGWKTANKEPVKNVDLWQELIKLCNFHNISWHWVKGHSKDKFNTLADKLAVKGRNHASKSLIQNVQ